MSKVLDIPLMSNNITREDLDVVREFLSGEPILTQSKNVVEFEKEWSQWVGTKYSVFVNSGSSANLLTMTVLKELYGAGEVIVPTLTWVSDIASVLQCGFTPVFVDIDPRTLAMDTDQVLSKINPQTRAVFLTHVLGYNGLNDKLVEGCKNAGVPIIEDVCESHGATFKGKKLGSFGLVSNFSFYYAHHMSTIEGGMVCTNDEKIYQMARMVRAHGMVRESNSEEFKAEWKAKYPELNPDFIFAYPSYNFRSTEINAVMGRNQLKRLDANNRKRTANLKLFLSNLNKEKYVTDFEIEGSCNYAFTLLMKNADKAFSERLQNAMREAKVEFRRGMSGGGNQLRQPYIQKHVTRNEFAKYPLVDHVHFYGFYIGNYPELSEQKILDLCTLLNSIN